MKINLRVIFAIPFIALVLWVSYLSYRATNGVEIKVPITGYDPLDLLSGHYIRYQIDWNNVDCSQFVDKVCHVKDFCKRSRRFGVECRFYIPEKQARDLDNLFRKSRFDKENLRFEVLYSYETGRKAIAKKLLINGEDWREYIKTLE